MIKSGTVDEKKIENVKASANTMIVQAEECKKLFNQQVSELKKDKFCQDVMSNIVQNSSNVTFDSISGLHDVKATINESLVLPSLRPDLFTGLRAPPRGILFYGPPGNGKTFLAKAVSNECKATFFAISASSIVSKWVGDSERMMKALFQVARVYQPSIIFVDEIDSLLTERKEGEQDSSRRLKTEFLVQFDGVTSSKTERITLIGATNLPNELDPAVLRRFEKRLFIPLPDQEARANIIKELLKNENYKISNSELSKVAKKLECYSASDLTNLVREAAMGPMREINGKQMMMVSKYNIRPIQKEDLENAAHTILPSTTPQHVQFYLDWQKKYLNSDQKPVQVQAGKRATNNKAGGKKKSDDNGGFFKSIFQ